MKQNIMFSMSPDLWFDVLKKLQCKYGYSVAFRRFRSECFDAQIRDVSELANWAELYAVERFSEIYINLNGEVPESAEDWGFRENNAADLIEFEGGRTDSVFAELWQGRVYLKKSNAQKLFNELVKEVKEVCRGQGLLTAEGVSYPTIIYDQWSAGFKLLFSFDDRNNSRTLVVDQQGDGAMGRGDES